MTSLMQKAIAAAREAQKCNSHQRDDGNAMFWSHADRCDDCCKAVVRAVAEVVCLAPVPEAVTDARATLETSKQNAIEHAANAVLSAQFRALDEGTP